MKYPILTEEMKDLLKSLKGAEFISYECYKTQVNGRVFDNVHGNLRIHTDKGSIELTNYLKILPLTEEDDTEDVATFECFKVDNDTPFKADIVGVEAKHYLVGEKIKEIEIVRDYITVDNGKYKNVFDQAIIIRTEKQTIMFYRIAWFSETIYISDHNNYDKECPVENVKEILENEDYYKIDVERKSFKL